MVQLIHLSAFMAWVVLWTAMDPTISHVNADTSNIPLVISLVGDSLTWGMGASNRKLTSYPAVIKGIVAASGNPKEVRNFGDNGKTALKSSQKHSYWNTPTYQSALKSNPSIVVIQLGTNDAKKAFWNETEFRNDYVDLIRTFQRLPTKPALYICIPPPLYSEQPVFGIQPHVVNKILPVVVPDIAVAANKLGGSAFKPVKVIDVFSALGGATTNFTEAYLVDRRTPMGKWPNDRCHLSDAGYRRVAETVAKAIL
jgi:lysophospholipase L1-like esterase